MSNFWPKGIKVSDIQSPMQILETAQKDWDKNSGGILALLLQKAKSESGNNIIIVHAKHVPDNRTITLFSVIYRPNAPYPASIEPKEDDLPNCLKKTYETTSSLNSALSNLTGQKINNTWVSNEPSEFRTKLEEVFNLGIVKSEILSLLSNFQDDS